MQQRDTMAAMRRQHHGTFFLENSVRPRSHSVSGVAYVTYALAVLSLLVVCGIGSRVATGAQPGSTFPPTSGGGATGDVAVSGASSESEEAKRITTPVGEAASGASAHSSTSDTSANASDTSASAETTASAAHNKRTGSLKNKLGLKLATPADEGTGEMAPVKKHPCLKNFTEMVNAIPKNVPAHEKANALVNSIEACGITVVCADFDNTILTTHTGGAWWRTRLAELKGKLSTDFVAFAQELNRRAISLHVVTFSDRLVTLPGRDVAGEMLVRAAIAVNGNPFKLQGVVGLRPDIYSDPRCYTALGLDGPPPRNKSFHVKQVASRTNTSVENILLVDDDRVNCCQHYKEGNLSLLVSGEGFTFDNISAVTSCSII